LGLSPIVVHLRYLQANTIVESTPTLVAMASKPSQENPGDLSPKVDHVVNYLVRAVKCYHLLSKDAVVMSCLAEVIFMGVC